METINHSILEEAAACVRMKWPLARPALGFVLGTGWNGAADFFQIRDSIPYDQIPGLGATQVVGHAGALCWAESGGVECFLFKGRRHAYEGAGWTPIALPIFILKKAGAQAVVLTNAAGILNPAFKPGQLMLIADHINFMGASPLCGPTGSIWTERFPDLSQVYDPELRRVLKLAAAEAGEDLKEGVFCACLGPNYETPAEGRMLKLLGADAVGMSTVPCAVLAKAAGLRVAAISCLSNYAAGIQTAPLTHLETVKTIDAVMARITRLLKEALPHLKTELADHK